VVSDWSTGPSPDSICKPAEHFGTDERGFFVANIKSQIKRNRTNEIARLKNKAVKSELRTRTKTAVAAVGNENEAEALRLAVKKIDKAAAKGVIHKNQAANRKSGLMRRIATLKASN
jgi:small subunit ribosomal protein S20